MEARGWLVIKYVNKDEFRIQTLVKDMSMMSWKERNFVLCVARLFGTESFCKKSPLTTELAPKHEQFPHLKAFSQHYVALEHLNAAAIRARLKNQVLRMTKGLSAADNFEKQAEILRR